MRPLLLFLLIALPVLSSAQKVQWERATINYGAVRDWNSPEAVFRFTNVGNGKLMFLPQRHDRDVLVRYPQRSFMPGESGEVVVRYYTGQTGRFDRTVEVYTNGGARPEKLTVKGNIKSIYADALTACPSFGEQTPVRSGSPNVVEVVDAVTLQPIPTATVEVYDRGVRKHINRTNADGVAINWIETGRYEAVVNKRGYEKAEEQVRFTERNRSQTIYLKRTSPEPPIQREPDPVQEEPLALGVSLNEQMEEEPEQKDPYEEDLGISLNDQYDEQPLADEQAEQTAEEEPLDLGININEQFEEEPPQEESESEELPSAEDLGIDLNDQLAEAEPQREEPVTEEEPALEVDEPASAAEVEELVEAALADANPPETTVDDEEPEFSPDRFRPNNLLLLLDVSGSMSDNDNMERLRSSIRRLVRMLREQDVLTIIAYNSTAWEVLPPTPVRAHGPILALVDSLQPGGYTNGVKGMDMAYSSLHEQVIPGGNNQLIVVTDGKFNSSKFSERDAKDLVKTNSDQGIILSIIGFGEDRSAGRFMQRLSRIGGGTFLPVRNNEDPTELLAEEIKLRSAK